MGSHLDRREIAIDLSSRQLDRELNRAHPQDVSPAVTSNEPEEEQNGARHKV